MIEEGTEGTVRIGIPFMPFVRFEFGKEGCVIEKDDAAALRNVGSRESCS